ncbi:MAG: hypothetical protein HYY19_08950 [Candidatus Rokubacteria bacterium]|nr:hypothetical protein [Candidatus Rokubacteria bacterium]
MMATPLERLGLLEQHVQRAVELIETLRGEKARLERENAELLQQLEAQGRELGELRARLAGLAQLEADHRRLLKEREELLAQVEGILKEIERLGV